VIPHDQFAEGSVRGWPMPVPEETLYSLSRRVRNHLLCIFRTDGLLLHKNGQEVKQSGIAGQQSAVLQLVVLELSFGLLRRWNAVRSRFIVDAKSSPHAQNIVRKKGR